MQRHKLARVRWQVGQTLLPEHFRAQDEALSSETRLHAELSGLPQVGIATFSWSEALLAEGSLSVSALTAVLPGGFLVDVPGNAALSPFSLEATGRAEVTVYLHLLEETRGAETVPLYADEPPGVQRYVRRLLLSSEQSIDRALASLELVVFSKNLEGAWRPAARKVPPLLLVGANPFLNELLGELDTLLEKAHGQLRTLLLDSYQRDDRLTSARRTLLEVRRLQSLRADMRGGICPHPYVFFDALRQFYFEVCCYLELDPDGPLPAYRHDALGAGLWGWMDLLDRAFRPEDTRLTYKSFEMKEGQFVLSPLPALEEGVQSELYLLVRSEDPSQRPSMEGVKMASPSRLSAVRRLALRGIPFEYVPHPAFPHAFGPEISWYKLSLGEEWQHALRDNGMAFFATSALQRTQVFLFWRRA
ncbi:type VI secretion system protein ImpJ [Stigmatella aurantiaca]|uniref:Type VI secretion system protein ImpJ n=1 Tax=Stigmatella aurantiaca TaxID=41 RepID=A0A1H7TY33_STIAU|nr:type VI secretion system baseplate subunit TssK [Stigmatella aurantiaca]SEL89336.1 type VI secretion system protein ImpJ [Stigmatella aurantiaca]